MKRSLTLAVLLTAGLGLGCYHGNLTRKGNVELHLGQGKNDTMAKQIQDPGAGERNGTKVLEHIDGITADGAMENFRRNEKAAVQERKQRDRSLTNVLR